jgi:hypothetical protein
MPPLWIPPKDMKEGATPHLVMCSHYNCNVSEKSQVHRHMVIPSVQSAQRVRLIHVARSGGTDYLSGAVATIKWDGRGFLQFCFLTREQFHGVFVSWKFIHLYIDGLCPFLNVYLKNREMNKELGHAKWGNRGEGAYVITSGGPPQFREMDWEWKHIMMCHNLSLFSSLHLSHYALHVTKL